MSKPSIPKGTRDFSPQEVSKRNYIIAIIKRRFEEYGFAPIETPSMENNETLLGKYGEEGDRLIFKILNSGDFLRKVNPEMMSDSGALATDITEKSLRYDLTVPFARYVVMHQNEIDFPFKRYQIQPVWRADRPQKGRFREFYQCDADVVGSSSLFQETELVLLYDTVFTELGLKGCTIKINNRKILAGIAEVIGAEDSLIDFTVALDKLDKIGVEKVKEEMLQKGISKEAVNKAQPLFEINGGFQDKLKQLKEFLATSVVGMQGILEITEVYGSVSSIGLQTAHISLEVTLARGLNYYTGAIFEVAAPEGVQMGSIGGGGRYDDLTGIFGLKNVSGVGISFGLDRICLVLEELNLFPKNIDTSLDVLVLNFGPTEAKVAFWLTQKLRKDGLRVDMYPDAIKVQKQFKYADKRNVPFVILAGDQEVQKGVVILKNMKTGKQEEVSLKNTSRLAEILKG